MSDQKLCQLAREIRMDAPPRKKAKTTVVEKMDDMLGGSELFIWEPESNMKFKNFFMGLRDTCHHIRWVITPHSMTFVEQVSPEGNVAVSATLYRKKMGNTRKHGPNDKYILRGVDRKVVSLNLLTFCQTLKHVAAGSTVRVTIPNRTSKTIHVYVSNKKGVKWLSDISMSSTIREINSEYNQFGTSSFPVMPHDAISMPLCPKTLDLAMTAFSDPQATFSLSRTADVSVLHLTSEKFPDQPMKLTESAARNNGKLTEGYRWSKIAHTSSYEVKLLKNIKKCLKMAQIVAVSVDRGDSTVMQMDLCIQWGVVSYMLTSEHGKRFEMKCTTQ